MASSHLILDCTLTEDFGGMKEVLSQVRPSWSWQDIMMKPFTAGITNKICGYYHNTDPKWDDMLLVRLYGKNTDLIINRADEQRNMLIMHEVGSGPPLYAVLNNALVYGFVQGVPTDVKVIRELEVRDLVAKEMAKLHNVDLSGRKGMDTAAPLLYGKMENFLKVVPTSLSDPEKKRRWEDFGKSIDDLRNEFELMKELTDSLGDLPCGFTHNDLLLENLIYNKENHKMSFIDYEYGGYNYTYFDIGNHFTEHAGVDPQPEHTLYPDRGYAKEWLKVYLRESKRLRGDEPHVTDDELEKACDISNLFALWAHLLWGVWSLVQAEHSLVPFDYVMFATSRLGAYFDRKDEFQAFLKNIV
ncbi:ethanolamine kinase 1-like [Watersipora subatra]|uniref:ethanolamine kinase 1-like n=1 Tax=Watersipora subatra TaxID=2589382 RepID=UPI00355BC5E2